jgi:hypothetical protein
MRKLETRKGREQDTLIQSNHLKMQSNAKWGSFDFPELTGKPKNFDDSWFKEKINTVMNARKNDINDQTAWAKCRHPVQCAFPAFSPLAKIFLIIATNVQAVSVIPCFSYQ